MVIFDTVKHLICKSAGISAAAFFTNYLREIRLVKRIPRHLCDPNQSLYPWICFQDSQRLQLFLIMGLFTQRPSHVRVPIGSNQVGPFVVTSQALLLFSISINDIVNLFVCLCKRFSSDSWAPVTNMYYVPSALREARSQSPFEWVSSRITPPRLVFKVCFFQVIQGCLDLVDSICRRKKMSTKSRQSTK